MNADGSPDKPESTDDAQLPGVTPPSSGPLSPSGVRFWQHVANMTSVGWSTVLPIAGGVLLGHYIDQRTNSDYTWTVGLLIGGIMVAFYNLYHILTKDLNE